MAASSYYNLLNLSPAASVQEIRRAYRELSKLYHPDTTRLPSPIATAKFQQLNEAYATLSNPEQRRIYDTKLGLSQPPTFLFPGLNQRLVTPPRSIPKSKFVESSGFIDPTDRPLSAGEIFALLILGLTLLGCLILAIAVGISRGEITFEPLALQPKIVYERVPLALVQSLINFT